MKKTPLVVAVTAVISLLFVVLAVVLHQPANAQLNESKPASTQSSTASMTPFDTYKNKYLFRMERTLTVSSPSG